MHRWLALTAALLAGCGTDTTTPSPSPAETESPPEREPPADEEPPATAPTDAPRAVAEEPPEQARQSCAELSRHVGIYAVRETGPGRISIRLTAGEGGELTGATAVAEISREHPDVNGDGRADYVFSPFQDDLGRECGNWGECVTGVLVSCPPDGWAEMVPADYRLGIAFDDTSTLFRGRRWPEIAVPWRSGDMLRTDEEEPGGTSFYRRTERGYERYREGAWGGSDRCAEHLRAGDLELAQTLCDEALAAARRPGQRGAILYNLGRIAEARGERDAARALYQRSIEARPNPIAETRLEALGGSADQAPAP